MTKKTQRQLVLEALECGEPQAVWQVSEKTGIREKNLRVVMDFMVQDGLLEQHPESITMVRQTLRGPREWTYKMYSLPKARAKGEQFTAPPSGVFGSMVAQCL